MHASSALEILRLADNEIGPRGTPLLAQMLQRAAKLEELDLRSTGVAAKLVVETLQKGTAGATLRILDLSGNKLSRADLAALFHFLGGCTAVRPPADARTHARVRVRVRVRVAARHCACELTRLVA
jgi:hypothetical protein